ncbi:proto-oncogene Mas-like isoform X2 [Hemicordylus capensis]|uniref:proto-oncogene Mas-like isoform X2 n=1 Tax=Hemicordylus capensis TaxID=884348 RepID=UPI002304481C|nr:proto-oncogene Mas-like isoform X2 [Hemicordylus capensis]
MAGGDDDHCTNTLSDGSGCGREGKRRTVKKRDHLILITHSILKSSLQKPVPIGLSLLLKMETMHAFGFNTSLYLLTAISAERYLAIFCPVWYERHRPLHFTVFLCIVLWILSAVVTLVVYLACHLHFNLSHSEVMFSCEPARIFQLVVNLLIFGPILILTSLALFSRIRKTSPSAKIDITIVVSVLLFLVLSASSRVTEILAYWVPSLHVPMLFIAFHMLDCIHSSGNPFLYLYIGYSKKSVAAEPIPMYLERAFMEEANTYEAQEANTYEAQEENTYDAEEANTYEAQEANTHKAPKANTYKAHKANKHKAPKANTYKAHKANKQKAPKAKTYEAQEANPYEAQEANPYEAQEANPYEAQAYDAQEPEEG